MTKYNNKKTYIDDIAFDSKAEANRYCELKLLEKTGQIEELTLQPKFLLQNSFKKNGKTHRQINYIADFMYWDCKNKKTIIEDVKGMKTEVYKIKKKLFEFKYPNYELIEIDARSKK